MQTHHRPGVQVLCQVNCGRWLASSGQGSKTIVPGIEVLKHELADHCAYRIREVGVAVKGSALLLTGARIRLLQPVV
jgi:hypothetical protein